MISMTILDATPFRAALDAEARSAAAARGRIGVGHLERRSAKLLDIVDLATRQQIKADGIDDQGNTIRFGHAIALLQLAEREAVGKAGAAAAVDGQAKDRGLTLLGGNEGDALGRAGGEDRAGHEAEIRTAA